MKNLKKYKKYHMYFEPVVIAGLDFSIIYKNPTAQSYLIKLQIKKNIRRVLDTENLAKLESTVETGMMSVIDVNIPPPVTRCAANIDEIEYEDETRKTKREKVIVLTFFSSMNLSKSGGMQSSIDGKLFELIELYNIRRMVLNDTIGYGLKKLENSFGQNRESSEIEQHLKFVTTNYKKMARLQLHFNAYINNMRNNANDREKEYYDVAEFCAGLRKELPRYLQSNGCVMNFDIEDEIFIVNVRRKDFFLMNLIIITFALKYSDTGSANLKFFTRDGDDNRTNGVIRYEFQANESFMRIYGDKFDSKFWKETENITDIDWLDLNLASVIADANNSVMDIKKDSALKKITLDVEIKGKLPDTFKIKNTLIKSFDFDSEQVRDMFEAEFSLFYE